VLQPLSIPNAHFWSRWDEALSLLANSYFFAAETGNVVVDPLAADEFEHRQIERLGGIAKVVVTTPNHERDSHAFAQRYGATIVGNLAHHEEVSPGMVAIRLQDQSTEEEFAVSIPAFRTVIVGDAILGTPAGALSMLPDAKYADFRKAALGLRRILRENPATLLVGHGYAIFNGAYDAVYRLLYAGGGAYVHRINLDELEFRNERDERDAQPAEFQCLDAEVGFTIGARRLGYRVSTLAPGKRFCPLHSHAREEELFFVLDGEPSVRTLSGTVRCRKGDFVALPVGDSGTHQLLNESDAPATVLLLGRTESTEVCYYPDSDKLLVDTERPIIKERNSIMVRASPDLEYFHGE
jgi:uncharacterized cupin superfamily protein